MAYLSQGAARHRVRQARPDLPSRSRLLHLHIAGVAAFCRAIVIGDAHRQLHRRRRRALCTGRHRPTHTLPRRRPAAPLRRQPAAAIEPEKVGGVIDRRERTIAHLSAILGLIFVATGALASFSRPGACFTARAGAVFGAGYADVHSVLPIIRALGMVIAFLNLRRRCVVKTIWRRRQYSAGRCKTYRLDRRPDRPERHLAGAHAVLCRQA